MPESVTPTKDAAAIAQKIAHVEQQLYAIAAHEKIVARVGGSGAASPADELAFQRARVDVLTWCAAHDAAAIVARRDAVHAALGPAGVAAKGGDMNGRPRDVVARIAEAELLDLALGE